MNNPAIYPPQHNASAYPTGYGHNPMAQGYMMANNANNTPPQFFPPNAFPSGGFPDQSQFQTPPQQQPHPSFPSQHAGFTRPDSRSSAIGSGFPQHPHPQSQPTPQPLPQPSTSAPESLPATGATPGNMMTQAQPTPNPNLAQQAQMQNAAQNARAAAQSTPTLSPQSQARERARVTVLLEINTVLLQEVVSLQGKGMAGTAPTQTQQSPNSPTSNDPNALSNSPVDAGKPAGSKPASQEYADCMRRLQANLSYLASIADAKKKPQGQIPIGPAIMIPPPHLQEVHDLYKKLNQLFPEASQSTINKAMAFASAQGSKPQAGPG